MTTRGIRAQSQGREHPIRMAGENLPQQCSLPVTGGSTNDLSAIGAWAVPLPVIWDNPRYGGWFRSYLLHDQSSSASRLTAGASGFLLLIQSGERPERYRESFRFDTMPALNDQKPAGLERAEQMRNLADELDDEQAKETMLRIANDYGRLAKRAEQRAKGLPSQ